MKTKIAFALTLAAPAMALAQNLDTTITNLGGWIANLIPIAFSAVLLFFFYGLAMFFFKSGEDKEKAKSLMIWGIIALFVMTSILGIVRFIGTSLGVQDAGSNFSVPTVNGSSAGSAGGG